MKLDNISFSSPKIICVSRDITCGCPYDIHGIAQVCLYVRHLLFDPQPFLVSMVSGYAAQYVHIYSIKLLNLHHTRSFTIGRPTVRGFKVNDCPHTQQN